jgi:uncharacterized protein YoxC
MGDWQRVDVELISGLNGGSLRLDLTDCPAVIEVAGLTFRALLNDDTLWTATGRDFCSFPLKGPIVCRGMSESGNACRFFSFGDDPLLFLQDLGSFQSDQPLRLQIWLRVLPEFSALVPLLTDGAHRSEETVKESEPERQEEVAALKLELERVAAERDLLLANRNQIERDDSDMARDYLQLKSERDSLAAEHEKLLAEHSKARTQIFLFKTEAKQARKELENTRSELMQVRISYDSCRTERLELENAAHTLRSDLEEREVLIERLHAALAEKDAAVQRLEATIHQLATCRSMRITAPMRAIGRLFKSA